MISIFVPVVCVYMYVKGIDNFTILWHIKWFMLNWIKLSDIKHLPTFLPTIGSARCCKESIWQCHTWLWWVDWLWSPAPTERRVRGTPVVLDAQRSSGLSHGTEDHTPHKPHIPAQVLRPAHVKESKLLPWTRVPVNGRERPTRGTPYQDKSHQYLSFSFFSHSDIATRFSNNERDSSWWRHIKPQRKLHGRGLSHRERWNVRLQQNVEYPSPCDGGTCIHQRSWRSDN